MSGPHGPRHGPDGRDRLCSGEAAAGPSPDRSSDERGVSEVLSYALLFSMILTMVGVTYTAGVADLRVAQQSEQIQNTERAFEVFASNVADIVYRGASSRSTTVTTSGSSVGLGDPVAFNLTLLDEGVSYSASVRPVVYHGDSADVVYSNGAVIHEGRDGSVLLHEPPMLLEDRVLVPYVITRAAGPERVGGESTVLIGTDSASRSAFLEPAETGDSYQLRLNVTTPRTGVWRRYLTSEADASCTTTGETVSCTFTAERVSVSVVRVDVRLRV